MAVLYAVAALDKFINDNKIRAMSLWNLSNIWKLVCGTSVDELRKTGLIANCTQEPVQFEVMYRRKEFAHLDPNNSRVEYTKTVYVPANRRVCAEPGETVKVRDDQYNDDDDIVVFKDRKGPFFVKRNFLHFWTDSAANTSFMRNYLPFLTSGLAAKNSRMIMYKSSVETFKIEMKKLGTDSS